MAFAITAGTGTTISADVYGTAHDVSSAEQTQLIGIATGTLGALALATAANPIPVRTGIVDLIQATPTCDTSILASGDLIFDVATITGAARVSGGATELVSVTIVDQDDNTASAYTIYVTNLSTSWGSTNSAPSLADAGGLGIQAIIEIAAADWKDIGAFKVAQPVATPFTPKICKTSGSANLYCVLVNGAGTPTFTASGIKVTFGFKQN